MTRPIRPIPYLAAISAIGLAVGTFATSASAADDAVKPAGEGKEKVVADAEGAPAGGVGGGGETPTGDSAGAQGEKEEEKKKTNPFAGSIFLFDQSATVNSFSKGSQLSYSPSYEWWISPRFYYTVKDHFKFGARFDLFKEFTNHEETTEAREWRPGDPWLTASYSNKATFLGKHPKSRFALGVLLRPPLSKESRANSQYFAFGPTASLTFGFDVAGSKSKLFQSASIGVSASYSHAFTKYTTPNGLKDDRPRTSVDDQVILDSQVRSSTLAGNSLIYALNGGIDILENLNFGASMIWINQFAYTPPDANYGGSTVPRGPNDTHFRQLSWFLMSIDYEPIKELGVSLGYYNLNTVVGLDGKYRNPLWSPDNRVFLSLTANLDAIYDDFTNKSAPKQTAIDKVRLFQ